MAYGPHTDVLLNTIETCDTELNVTGMNITSLPKLPSKLKKLDCSDTLIASLPELPAELEVLSCTGTRITSLPELPNSIKSISCCDTLLTSLPKLPNDLGMLWCSRTRITVLPKLPDSLWMLNCFNTPLTLKVIPDESVDDYRIRLNEWHEEQESKDRIQQRTRLLFEEIVMKAWHPRKVEKWIEAGVELEDL